MSPTILNFNILQKEQSLFLLSVPVDDSQFWDFKITYESTVKYVDPNYTGVTVLETQEEITINVSYFWSNLIKFASMLTCIYATVILFIIIHNFDSDNDFEKRKRAEMELKIQNREDGDESSEGRNNGEMETSSKSSNSNSTTHTNYEEKQPLKKKKSTVNKP